MNKALRSLATARRLDLVMIGALFVSWLAGLAHAQSSSSAAVSAQARPSASAEMQASDSSLPQASAAKTRKLDIKGFAPPMTRTQIMAAQEGRSLLECRADPQDALVETCRIGLSRNGGMCETVVKPPSKIPERVCSPAPKGLQQLTTYAGFKVNELYFRFFDGQLLRLSVFPNTANRGEVLDIVRTISEKYGPPDEEEGGSRRWRETGERMLLVGPNVVEIASIPLYEAKKARWAAGESDRQKESARSVAEDKAASAKRKADF